jgi:hypothetical protein
MKALVIIAPVTPPTKPLNNTFFPLEKPIITPTIVPIPVPTNVPFVIYFTTLFGLFVLVSAVFFKISLAYI